ncbi:Glyoxalase/bleomycin resistance protein/dioxygenase [Catenulispora acidiphila DSM 44928]|uniref:Glyoxalase/bleomycin resistance protein/dioxygenase n=1 Tax=Catenulispora acidiphila (strain DSM 44928 / JCM 14897 / NBRC 102108 / NRRL B-24433 / ID139908) TaxID=479433 RepID=C7Q7K6_CATAD|nr:VOC family protein [Catenulispora acidiphila]ACU72199.1 Glyoxalase/bleomycin resistance protein/dioxygenase [Catenulispora acidiphila DSM 44928]
MNTTDTATLKSTTHINFRGDARPALEFYRDVFDGDLTVITYGAMNAAQRPEEADQIMWGQVTAPSGFAIMAYDVPADRPYAKGVAPFFESVRGESLEAVTPVWKKLSEGATVLQELAPSPWAPAYGMLTDRFGVTWVVDVAADTVPAT